MPPSVASAAPRGSCAPALLEGHLWGTATTCATSTAHAGHNAIVFPLQQALTRLQTGVVQLVNYKGLSTT
jgi:hypothetical protein